MTFERFCEIFHEEGITDEELILGKWKLAEFFEGTENLKEDLLRESIRLYLL